MSEATAGRRPRVILATDCGSTTTKAILIQKFSNGYRQTHRGEASTTVEAPFEDVTRGVLDSIEEVEELSGRRILDGERIITPVHAEEGVDVYISTSSAGGGLQMLVAGAVQSMTAESAERAALGAGAIVMDAIASNDGRLPHQKIARIRELRPDMILLSGGTDGGTVSHVVELAEYVAAARPLPRLGTGFRLPLVYAGNKDARHQVGEILEEQTDLTITENIRPVLERENLAPARRRIQELFLEHVMAHAPGYDRLIQWTDAPIMPTPAAVGQIMQGIAQREGINLMGIDVGGATTDVFSVFGGVYNRTVSANVGMSYSISNVLAQRGPGRVLRWMPRGLGEGDLANRVKNKMIRPTTVPQTMLELVMEQAIAREAIAMALGHHKQLASGLKGVQREREISDAFQQKAAETLIDMGKLQLIVGSGGVLSHAPRRAQAMMMMIDAFQPEGVTEFAVDSIFMMPHLGVLKRLDEEAALEVFRRDCLIPLGTCIAAVGTGKTGKKCLEYRIQHPERGLLEGELQFGRMLRVALEQHRRCDVEITPVRGIDVGAGRSVPLHSTCGGGEAGLVLDARGRPLEMDYAAEERPRRIQEWYNSLDAYPDGAL